ISRIIRYDAKEAVAEVSARGFLMITPALDSHRIGVRPNPSPARRALIVRRRVQRRFVSDPKALVRRVHRYGGVITPPSSRGRGSICSRACIQRYRRLKSARAATPADIADARESRSGRL